MSNEHEHKGDSGGQRKPPEPGPKHIIFVNEVRHEVHAQALTGAQIKGLAGVASDYQLFLEQSGEDKPIPDNELVKLHDNMKFYTLPPATFG